MMRGTAEDIARSTIHFCETQLRRAIQYEEMGHLATAHLRSARDRLHEACRMLENDETSEVYEDVYLVLFDALAFVTDAMRMRVFNRTMIEGALQMLLKLREHIGPAAV